MFFLLVTYNLVLLHVPGGGIVEVNPEQVVSMRSLRPGDPADKLLTDKVECVISTTDGKLINVMEECEEVDKLFRKAVEHDDSEPDGR